MDKLKAVIILLARQDDIPALGNDHPLKGNRKGFRDLHIEPDRLLICRAEDDELQLAATGSHADIFDE